MLLSKVLKTTTSVHPLLKVHKTTNAALLFAQPSMSFARYFNRAQQQDFKYKTDMTAYQYRPDLIYKIDPAPQYPDGPHPLPEKTALERQKFRDSLEKFRDNSIAKKRQRDRVMTGRLFAHLR